MTVWRGVDESYMQLPPGFLDKSANKQGFAGGVEMAFMSTTTEPKVALNFSGGPDKLGTIFGKQFTATVR